MWQYHNVFTMLLFQQPRVVLDTRISGRWGGQERPPNFPIRRGVTNDVTVYANASGFDIYANSGAFHYLYNYRTDITQISTLTYGYAASVVHNVSVGKVSKSTPPQEKKTHTHMY